MRMTRPKPADSVSLSSNDPNYEAQLASAGKSPAQSETAWRPSDAKLRRFRKQTDTQTCWLAHGICRICVVNAAVGLANRSQQHILMKPDLGCPLIFALPLFPTNNRVNEPLEICWQCNQFRFPCQGLIFTRRMPSTTLCLQRC